MQITFTAEQLSWARTAVGTMSTVVTLWGLLRKAYLNAIVNINKLVTTNVNRAIEETKDYADQKFIAHEREAFNRLDNQDIIIKQLVEEVKKINDKLK